MTENLCQNMQKRKNIDGEEYDEKIAKIFENENSKIKSQISKMLDVEFNRFFKEILKNAFSNYNNKKLNTIINNDKIKGDVLFNKIQKYLNKNLVNNPDYHKLYQLLSEANGEFCDYKALVENILRFPEEEYIYSENRLHSTAIKFMRKNKLIGTRKNSPIFFPAVLRERDILFKLEPGYNRTEAIRSCERLERKGIIKKLGMRGHYQYIPSIDDRNHSRKYNFRYQVEQLLEILKQKDCKGVSICGVSILNLDKLEIDMLDEKDIQEFSEIIGRLADNQSRLKKLVKKSKKENMERDLKILLS